MSNISNSPAPGNVEVLDLTPDYAAAHEFFRAIRPVEECTFQLFDDTSEKRPWMARIFHGRGHSIDLAAMNAAGAGIFVAANEMNGGRSLRHLVAITAVVADFDDGAPGSVPLEPTLKVKTSTDPATGVVREQWWWRVAADEYLAPLELRGIMRRLVADYGADAQAIDAARCGRLPGFHHMKATPQRVEIIGGTREPVRKRELLAAFPAPPEPPRPAIPSAPVRAPTRYAKATVARLQNELATAADRRRNATLNYAAFRAAQVGLGRDEVWAAFAGIALGLGLTATEIKATIGSAIEGAARKAVGA